MTYWCLGKLSDTCIHKLFKNTHKDNLPSDYSFVGYYYSEDTAYSALLIKYAECHVVVDGWSLITLHFAKWFYSDATVVMTALEPGGMLKVEQRGTSRYGYTHRHYLYLKEPGDTDYTLVWQWNTWMYFNRVLQKVGDYSVKLKACIWSDDTGWHSCEEHIAEFTIPMIHNVVEGIENTNNNNLMSWWKTNLGMPIPYLFDLTYPYSMGGPFTFYNKGTSFDLSGFSPGWKIAAFFCTWHWHGPLTGSGKIYSKWRDRYGNTLSWGANGTSVNLNLASGYWQEVFSAVDISGWELDGDGNFSVQSWCDAVSGDDISIPIMTTTVAFNNVPDATTISGKEGHIWVENNNLCYIDASGWKQTMIGIDQGLVDVGKQGYLWIDDSMNYLHWIGSDGHDYRAEWRIQQFASTWTNGPVDERNPGVSYKGYIWVDNEFGKTHLSYIGANGYKFLTGSGHYPYQPPY